MAIGGYNYNTLGENGDGC